MIMENNFRSENVSFHTRQFFYMLAIGLLLTACILWLWRRRKIYYIDAKIPGPLALPLIGTVGLFGRKGVDLLQVINKAWEYGGDLSKLWFGPYMCICVRNPKMVHALLKDRRTVTKPFLYKIIFGFISEDNIFVTANEQKWRKHRKFLTPSFSKEKLNAFLQVFNRQSLILEELLKNKFGEKNINFYQLAVRFTMGTICETAMDVKMDFEKDDSSIIEVVERATELMTYRAFRPWLYPKLIYKFNKKLEKHTIYLKIFQDFVDLILQRTTIERKRKISSEEESHINKQKIMPIFENMMKNPDFSEEDILNEIKIFLMAGTETTANTLAHLCILLGMHPDIQDRVYEESISVYDDDDTITYTTLQRLQYTERVIKEGLRIFPVGPILFRKVTDDIELEDWMIPKDCWLGFNFVHLHRSPDFWSDPLVFNPDRFLPSEIDKIQTGTFIPFSYGPRNCIAERYAMMAMKVMLSRLVRHARVFTGYNSVEEVELEMHSILKVKDGHKLWFEARNQK